MAIEKLTGRVAIVTGGAAGIGGEIARTLAADEAQVLIVDIDESTAAANVERIEAAGGRAASMVGDVAREEVAKEMVERVVAELAGHKFSVGFRRYHFTDGHRHPECLPCPH